MSEFVAGEGLVLRPPRTEDRQGWLDINRDPLQLAFGSPAYFKRPDTLEAFDEPVRKAQEAFAVREPGILAVSSLEGRFLGIVTWRHDVHSGMAIADIGYVVHPDSRGRGVASRAAWTLTHWLLHDDDGPHQARVQLDHSVENIASCRVALAAGLAVEGIRRHFMPLPDPTAPDGVRRHDVCLHGITETEPMPPSPARAGAADTAGLALGSPTGERLA